MVMAQSMFTVLRQQHPHITIDVLAPAWSRALLERMLEVRQAIDMPVGHGELRLALRRRLGRQLRNAGYQQAIVLPNSFKSALIPWWAGIPRRTGFIGESRFLLLNYLRRLDKKKLPMTVQRFMALALPADGTQPADIPRPRLTVNHALLRQALQRLMLERPHAPLLVLCPGAEYGAAKRWPARHYAAVARQHLDSGGTVWLFGSEKDAAVTAEVNQLAGNRCTDLGGRTRLSEAIDLMSLADAVVSNDSGLMHVAAALGRPLVAVYGSSDPGFTPPLSNKARIVRLGLDCSPCFKRECPLGHLNCLQQLEPERVLAALGEVLP
jgi:heptosyltransferase-2